MYPSKCEKQRAFDPSPYGKITPQTWPEFPFSPQFGAGSGPKDIFNISATA